MTVDRLRSGDLARPFWGGRTTAPPATTLDRSLALLPLLSADQRFSHLTAAELHGMRLPERLLDRRLHVVYQDAHRAMRRPDVVGHRSRNAAAVVLLVSGLRASAPVEAWCECAALLGIDDLVVMGDGLLSRRSPVATPAELRAAVHRRPGRRGTARLRAALTLIRPRTDSARETMLRLLLMRAGFREPEINHPLRDRRDVVIAHGDLVWPTERVVVEYDGRQHAVDATQFAIDIRRLDDIAELGYRVIRVDRQLMSDATTLIAKISRALASPRTEGSQKAAWRAE